MKTRTIFTVGFSSFALSCAAIGGIGTLSSLAVASAKHETQDVKRAAKEAAVARKALQKRQSADAMAHAEAAVAMDPQNAQHRALLGEAYLFAGRFVSAGQALTDALSLDPSNGRAALNLSLAQIATGDWNAARTTLEAHADTIGTADRGLALALAGDPAGAVQILMAATQAEGDAKLRQNLALALALSGEWQKARLVASADLSPADVDQRMMQWASFARPANSYDQVASLLGVAAVADQGQPTKLALNLSNTSLAVAQAVDPVDVYMPGSTPEAVPAPVAETPQQVAAVEAQPVEVAPAPAFETPTTSGVVFAARQEVVQSVPQAKAQPTQAAAVVRKSAPVRAGKGGYYVQIGAFANANVARIAWNRAAQRVPVLADHAPTGMRINARGRSLYRLSVGGFARGEADGLCGKIRSSGGVCFVRAGAGDQLASWAKGGMQLAAR